MVFEPKKYLIKVNGGRMYLPVSARLIWFREEHPDWGIETRPVTIDVEKQYAIFEAFIYNAEGKLMATGTKMEDVRGFGDFLEKSETGAIGRALAVCGYGTQFAPDIDDHRGPDQPQGGGGQGGQGTGNRYGGGNRYNAHAQAPQGGYQNSAQPATAHQSPAAPANHASPVHDADWEAARKEWISVFAAIPLAERSGVGARCAAILPGAKLATDLSAAGIRQLIGSYKSDQVAATGTPPMSFVTQPQAGAPAATDEWSTANHAYEWSTANHAYVEALNSLDDAGRRRFHNWFRAAHPKVEDTGNLTAQQLADCVQKIIAIAQTVRPEADPFDDTPAEQGQAPTQHPAQPAATPQPTAAEAHACRECGRNLTESQQALSERKYGMALCPTCQKQHREAVAV